MDHSLSGSSVHGILHAKILKWVAMLPCRGIFPTQGSEPCLYVSCIGRQVLYHHCATREAPNLVANILKKWVFPGGASGKEPACQYRKHGRHGFDLWIRKIPWRRACNPLPVFLPENHMDRAPGRLQYRASQSIRQYWSNLAYTNMLKNILSLWACKGLCLSPLTCKTPCLFNHAKILPGPLTSWPDRYTNQLLATIFH